MFCRIARRGTLLRGSFRTIKNVHRKSSAVWFSATSSSDEETITDDYGLYRLLTPEERGLLAEQRKLTETSRQLASKVGGSKFSVLTQSSSFLEELQLDASFSVVIAGEFNAGKSTLINALLGTKLLESGALPTTDSITIVASASSSREDIAIPLGVKMHSVKEDLPLLEDLTLIDTPGTNSAWMDHTERTLRLLPAADLILFVTSADRPFSDSERSLLKSIQSYRKSIVVVINKMDILDATGGDHGQESKQAIIDFVTDHASELLGARPTVLAVSARDALSAKIMSKSTGAPTASDHQRSNVWHRSNFGTLESFLKDSLTAQTKLKSKLSNPVGLTEGLMAQCMGTLQEQGMDLEADIATLNILQSQFEGWKKELFADMAISRQNMTDMVRKEGERGAILLSRINFYNFYAWTLFGTQQLEREWKDIKRQASAHRHKDLEADLLEQVQETA